MLIPQTLKEKVKSTGVVGLKIDLKATKTRYSLVCLKEERTFSFFYIYIFLRPFSHEGNIRANLRLKIDPTRVVSKTSTG